MDTSTSFKLCGYVPGIEIDEAMLGEIIGDTPIPRYLEEQEWGNMVGSWLGQE